MPPSAYDISCDLCGGDVEWSEYEHMVWCEKCQKDTRGNEGIFDGPIPYEITQMIGISFDRIDLKSKKRLYVHMEEDGHLVWEETPWER